MTSSSVGERGAAPNRSAVRSSRRNDTVENVKVHSSRPLGELPRELSSFVGREHEIAEVKCLLAPQLPPPSIRSESGSDRNKGNSAWEEGWSR